MESKLPAYSEALHKGKPIIMEPSAFPQKDISNVRDVMWGSHKDSSFSKKLLQHGMFYEKTMDAAERIKQSEEAEIKKRKEAITRACATFDEYVISIRKIQNDLAAKQKEMAFVAVQKYSALCIQTCFRAYRARLFAKRKYYARLLCTFARFKRRFGRRIRCTRIIQKCYRKYRSHLYARHIRMILSDTQRLQNQFRKMLETKKAFIKEEAKETCMAVVNLSLLHGSTRAIKEVQLKQLSADEFSLRYNAALNSLVKIYKRNRRFRLLRNNFGKLVYAALNYHCHEEIRKLEENDEFYPTSMHMYQYIKLKIESSIKKSPIKRAPSKGVASKSAVKSSKVESKSLVTSASHATKLPIHEDDTNYTMHIAFPNEHSGFYTLRSISDVIDLIEDMIIVGKECTSYVDGRVPLAVYNSAINTHVVTNVLGTYNQKNTVVSMSRKALTAKELWPHYVPPVDPRVVEEEEAAIAAMVAALEAEEKKKKGRGKRGRTGVESIAVATSAVKVIESGDVASSSLPLQPAPPLDVVPSATKSGGVGAGRKAIQK